MEVALQAENDLFVVCLFKCNETDPHSGLAFIDDLEETVAKCDGKVQLRTDMPKDWEIFDGKDNFREPNHLNPAIFHFQSIMIAGFSSTKDVVAWWNSDIVFELLKYRTAVEKMGVFTIEGLRQSYDVTDDRKAAFGERLALLEFMNMQSFKPVQQYVDNYRLFAERSLTELGMDCNLFFADGVSGVLMNEFPLDAVCGSSWRMKTDAQFFYDSDSYQRQLMYLRREYSRSVVMLVPMIDERQSTLHRQRQARKKQQQAALTHK